MVDNTFSPLILSPIQLGADIVVYSLTKFVNGASDYIASAICASQDFLMQLMDLHTGSLMLLGPTMGPKAAFNISMRLPHLGLRMTEEEQRRAGIRPGLVRMSIGYTGSLEQRWEQLRDALEILNLLPACT